MENSVHVIIENFITKCNESNIDFFRDCSTRFCEGGDTVYKNPLYKLVTYDEMKKQFQDVLHELEEKMNLENIKPSSMIKKILEPNTKIVFVGDYHSNLHAFIVGNWI